MTKGMNAEVANQSKQIIIYHLYEEVSDVLE
jgi:hypothetical protein